MKILKVVMLVGVVLALSCSSDRDDINRSHLVAVPDQAMAFNLGHQEREPSTIMVFQNGIRKLLTTYNDSYNNPFVTGVGFAVSADVNTTPISWQTVPTPSFDPAQVLSLTGDTWLTADANTHTIVYFVTLAHMTTAGGGGFKIVYGKSTNGGASWLNLNGNFNLTNIPITFSAGHCYNGGALNHDKPSITTSANGNDVYIAYNCDPDNFQNILHVARKIGNTAWDDRTPTGQVAGSSQTPAPIIKTKPSCVNCVFLAWQDPSTPVGTRNIVWSASTNKGKDWSSTPFLVVSNPQLGQPFNGANSTLERNAVHFSFDLDRKTDACVVAFENNGRVYYTKADGPNFVWTAPVDIRTDFPSKREFQPFIITSKTTIVIAYYEQNPNSAVTSVRLAGCAGSCDNAMNWTIPLNNLLTDTTFLPCGQNPSTMNPPDNGLDFGDYLGVAPLARETETTGLCGGLMMNANCSYQFWGAWADSRTVGGCNNGSGTLIADPQHVVGVLALVQ